MATSHIFLFYPHDFLSGYDLFSKHLLRAPWCQIVFQVMRLQWGTKIDSSCPALSQGQLTWSELCHTLWKIVHLCPVNKSFFFFNKSFAEQINRGKAANIKKKCSSFQRSVQMGTLGFAVTFRALVAGTNVRWLQVEACSAAFLNLLTYQRHLSKVKNGAKSELWKWWSCFGPEPGELSQVDLMSPPAQPLRGSLEFSTSRHSLPGWEPLTSPGSISTPASGISRLVLTLYFCSLNS